jgi:hypothetical protein
MLVKFSSENLKESMNLGTLDLEDDVKKNVKTTA